jgi:hypothetical protein
MATTTTLEIHPAIGIARMGSSDELFFGPEPGLPTETNRRDATPNKLLKRQAARFRVYSCVRDEQGTLVSFEELSPAKATITWTVHLVNRKAAGPRFLGRNGMPNTDPTYRRNGATGDDALDSALIIDGGIQTLTGPLQPRKTIPGQFMGNALPRGLGEMSTDADGRLVVVGGFGLSRSFPTTPIGNFADNDNWHDDISDGPVEATVHFLDGRADQAVDKPAWVIACQPDFAPGVGNLVTLYDAFIDQAIARGVLPMPTFRPAYDRDVLPLLNRATAYRWVNTFARDAHAPGRPADFGSIPNLGDPTVAVPKRKSIFRLLRNPAGPATPPGTPVMPSLFSDDYDFTGATPNRLVLPLTRPQYRILLEWSNDAFDATGPAPTELEPDALTRMVLDACAGGSFCPGIEAGRKIRDASIYAAGEVFRFDRTRLNPGGLTESMALPWQADFADCAWESPSPPVPPFKGRGWWPAQRPDDVLLHPDDAAMVPWARGVDSWQSMVDQWDQLGVVLQTADSSGAPAFVETQRNLPG